MYGYNSLHSYIKKNSVTVNNKNVQYHSKKKVAVHLSKIGRIGFDISVETPSVDGQFGNAANMFSNFFDYNCRS
jgi:hypothetical protein